MPRQSIGPYIATRNQQHRIDFQNAAAINTRLLRQDVNLAKLPILNSRGKSQFLENLIPKVNHGVHGPRGYCSRAESPLTGNSRIDKATRSHRVACGYETRWVPHYPSDDCAYLQLGVELIMTRQYWSIAQENCMSDKI